MSFIPGEGSETLTIASQAGSGISINAVSDVNYLSANLIAGTNISLVPSVSNTSITINASGGGGGIASVSSAVGSGIEATTTGSAVSLTSGLVAGTGISLVPSGVNKNLTINNTQTITSAIGSGITATTTGASTALTANITAGNGISITPSGANTSKQISNSGVLSVIAGTGISVNQATGNTTITNTGLMGLTSANAGANIVISGTASAPIISASSPSTNDGVRYNAVQALTRPGQFGSTFNPVSIFSIVLPVEMQSCNVFTMYIRSMAFVASVSGTLTPDYRVYLSDQAGSATSGQFDSNEGALSYVDFDNIQNGQGYGASSLVWNYRPSQLTNTLFINGFKTDGGASSAFAMNGWEITFDLVGQRMLLV
jgi:hypothetical protein